MIGRIMRAIVGLCAILISSETATAADVLSGTRTGSSLIVNRSVNGQFETADDDDWYRVQLTRGHIYAFSSARAGTVGVYSGSGSYLTGDFASSANFIAPTTGTYFVSVKRSGAAGVFYSVLARALDTNGSRDDARPVNGGVVRGTNDGHGRPDSTDFFRDQDYYYLSLRSGITYTFEIKILGGAAVRALIPRYTLRLVSNRAAILQAIDTSIPNDLDGPLRGSFARTITASGQYFLVFEDREVCNDACSNFVQRLTYEITVRQIASRPMN